MTISRLLNGAVSVRAAGLLVLVLVWLQLFVPDALADPSLIVSRAAVIGMVALGLTLVFIHGELDLSVGSVVAAAGGMMAAVPGSLLTRAAAAVLFGLAVGFCNGLLVTRLGVNSFVATLGTMLAVRGLALQFTHSKPTALPDGTDAIIFIQREFLGLTVKVWAFLVAVAIASYFLTRTRTGRDFFVIGGNVHAARSVGINVAHRKTLAFVMCGGVAACGGVLDTMALGTADPTGGQDALLTGVSAAVIGGCVLTGGHGSAFGTAVGAVAMSALAVGLGFQGTAASVQTVITGSVLLLAIASDRKFVHGALRLVRRMRTPVGATTSHLTAHKKASA
jgi:ribose transport system permease protein